MTHPDAIEESGPERTCVGDRLERPARGDAALRAVRRRRRDARHPPALARPRRVDAARRGDGSPGGGQDRSSPAAFRAKAEAAPELADDVDRLLEADALQFLSLVNKAGQIVDRRDRRSRRRSRSGKVVGLIHASDGSADGAEKLDRLSCAALEGEAAAVPRINLFASRQLDLALGRTNVIHAALIAGAASAAFLAKVERLTQLSDGRRDAFGGGGRSADAGASRRPRPPDETDDRAGVTGRTHERNEQ